VNEHLLTAITAKPGSQQYQAVLDSLFSQNPRPSLRFLYDSGMPEHALLRGVVVDHLVDLFRLHGAVDVETPLFLPLMKGHIHEQRQVLLLDRHGDIVTLPVNALVPFARLAARTGVTRIKRYHITDTYKEV
jgi:translation initiation factor 2-alpha kinase 4